ncbi:RagB/SusD family nutrient uptake outer membrane protein [Chitinophagaceae bacterium LB-8]|uniref:RagB/SusD family nutrient uptake outer membrane protein n=1 Tax=Paraflavisolibacter caeni TaxID=2982496 RepID=A0A9X3BHL6_9BACT|nr:RagB/SusD family nutrient uptake outer membrane protein [Paraflavisolibacter caeni]MCU7552534.1 RagB/SusD family nutrient uptake outer membrane protein [Paraflavisolibacter caeni]
MKRTKNKHSHYNKASFTRLKTSYVHLKWTLLASVLVLVVSSCKKYLDIVPDNIATIDQAFDLRASAKKYLFSCYSYLPMANGGGFDNAGNVNHTIIASRETCTPNPGISPMDGFQALINMTYGLQSSGSPVANYWDGENGGTPLFGGIRDCNIFLANIDRVPDITIDEKAQWTAEVKFLKAYYHFFLMRMYGPVPVMRKNIEVSADVDAVKVKREPVDTVVNYIVQLLDEATPDLPLMVSNQVEELGRATKTMALAVKAQTLVLAASPLFNGNADYAGFKDKEGQQLINATYDAKKWQKAADACKAAIDMAKSVGNQLFYFTKPFDIPYISPATQTCMNIRGAITESWNPETIWGAANRTWSNVLQSMGCPRHDLNGNNAALLAANINTCESFYTKNGVPIDEDFSWDYANRYTALKTIPRSDSSILKPNYVTSSFNVDRELRFYADLAFDGSSFFTTGRTDEKNLMYINTMWGSVSANSASRASFTGYWPKKLVNYKNSGTTTLSYVWPTIRLSELYLMYAESLNEVEGPSNKVYQWVDSVRTRAGLKGVVESWQNFSRQPNKPASKDGLRSIIQQETMNEFMFEGNNFWNERRWKRLDLMNRPITAWDYQQNTPQTFYRLKTIYTPSDTYRDYLTPIKQYNLFVNHNLVQNPLW